MLTNLLLILLLPLAGFVVQMFFGRRLPRGGDWVPTGMMGIALLLAIVTFARTMSIFDPQLKQQFQWNWLTVTGFTAGMGILFDNLTAVMLMVVTLVSFLVHLFSVGYMHDDVRYSRYFGYLGLFSFSMLGIVLCDNLLALYIFWELVGLSSYLLIGHWFEKKSASDAAKKAFITTRIGDVGMFIGILILYSKVGSFRYDAVFHAVANGQIGGSLLTAAGICDLLRGDRQERPVPAPRLAARRDGRPDPGQRPDPRGHHGGRGRLHGRTPLPDLHSRRACSSSPTSA